MRSRLWLIGIHNFILMIKSADERGTIRKEAMIDFKKLNSKGATL